MGVRQSFTQSHFVGWSEFALDADNCFLSHLVSNAPDAYIFERGLSESVLHDGHRPQRHTDDE
jgi:hypothetical protein